MSWTMLIILFIGVNAASFLVGYFVGGFKKKVVDGYLDVVHVADEPDPVLLVELNSMDVVKKDFVYFKTMHSQK